MADRQYPPIPCPQPRFIQPYASHVAPPPVNGGLQMAYLNPAHGSQTWVPEQAAASHSIPNVGNVVQPLVEIPLPVASSNPPQTTNWSNAHLRSNAPKRKPNLSQSVQCEICDIYCNSLELYEKHLSGKKHLKTLKKNYPSLTTPSQPTPQSVVNSSTPEKPLTTCNVPCDSDRVMEDHFAGHEHGLRGQQLALRFQVSPGEDLGTKKRKLIQCGAAEAYVHVCTVCNVVCNSAIVFANHCLGKKHIAQVQKSSGGCDNPSNRAKPTRESEEIEGDTCELNASVQ